MRQADAQPGVSEKGSAISRRPRIADCDQRRDTQPDVHRGPDRHDLSLRRLDAVLRDIKTQVTDAICTITTDNAARNLIDQLSEWLLSERYLPPERCR